MTADLNNNNKGPQSEESSDNNVIATTETATEKMDKKEPAKEESQLPAVPLQLPPTNMLYYTYEGNSLTTCRARVLSIQEKTTTAGSDKNVHSDNVDGQQQHGTDDGIMIVDVCLDQTILHAQGGGQPTDFGSLLLVKNNDSGNNDNVCQVDGQDSSVVVQVDKVLMNRSTGVATHTGRLVHNGKNASSSSSKRMMLQVGDVVQVTVDKERRQILSECHTAGHVVDAAMAQCGKILKPSKGYHFLDGPYVEYQGSIAAAEKDQLLQDLQDAYCQLVHQDIETKIELLSKDEADCVCNRLAPNYFDVDALVDAQTQQIRVVTVAGYPCPCGGTHVARTGDLKQRQWNITGIKSKKGMVRVKYGPGKN